MVKALHRAGIEVILDVVYNHTAEGGVLGPSLAFRGIDNVVYYRTDPGDPRRVHRRHRNRQHARPLRPRRAAARARLAPVLGGRVPRRRVPVRPRLGARAGRLRTSTRRPRSSTRSTRPRAVAGEADRGAVGRRARAATRSAATRCSGASGTGVPRHDARLLARPHGGGGLRAAVHRLERRLRRRRADAVRVGQLRHLPRRLHAPRPRLVRAQAQRGERRGRTATAPTTTAAGTAASRGRRPSRRSTRCATGRPGTCSRRCSSRRARRCCSPGTSCAARSAATTTPTARTTRSPGSTGRSTSGPRSCCAFTRASSRCAGRTRSSGGGRSSPARSTWARARPTCGGSDPTGGG